MEKQGDNLVLVDLGTSKTVVLVVGKLDNGEVSVLGLGIAKNLGIKKGVIVNIEEVEKSLHEAISSAEQSSGIKISNIMVNITGLHIDSLNSMGLAAINNRTIVNKDIEHVIATATAIPIATDTKILHVLPREFKVDHDAGITLPLGMSAVRLESNVHIVTAGVSQIENLARATTGCGLGIDDITFNAIATSYGVLTDDEKNHGVCLLDIGAGTTDIAVYKNGTICHSAVLPVGCNQVTKDIAVALRVSNADALSIQKQCCVTQKSLSNPNEQITINNYGVSKVQRVSKFEVATIMQDRIEELLTLVYENLKQANLVKSISAGLVISGGGANLTGMCDLANQVFNWPVRVGLPLSNDIMPKELIKPEYATIFGLLKYAITKDDNNSGSSNSSSLLSVSYGFVDKLKSWFKDNF